MFATSKQIPLEVKHCTHHFGCKDVITNALQKGTHGRFLHTGEGSRNVLTAVTVTMWDMHKSTSSGKWEDMDFGDSNSVETLIFVDIFFLLTTLMMIKTDLVGIWYSPGLEYYFSPNIGPY